MGAPYSRTLLSGDGDGTLRVWDTERGQCEQVLQGYGALNGLLVAERRGRLDAPRRHRLAGFLQALPVTLDPNTAGQAWTATAYLAERHGLGAYDAAYLELALRHQLPLASLDRSLRSAAGALGLALLGIDQ